MKGWGKMKDRYGVRDESRKRKRRCLGEKGRLNKVDGKISRLKGETTEEKDFVIAGGGQVLEKQSFTFT